MKSPVLRLDDEVGQMIGFTSDFFEHGIIWNSLPRGIYINALWPIKGKEDEAIEQMLEKFEELRIRTRFIAPSDLVIKHLKQHGYFFYKDPAGVPNWVRLSEKGMTALCGRIGLTPEELIRQSEDYDV